MKNTYSIYIDPGHVEGYNKGYNQNYAEGTYMYILAEKMKALLQLAGFRTYISRTKTENPDIYERGKNAASLNVDIFISLHTNASSSSVSGTEIIYSFKTEAKKSFYERYAKKIASVINNTTTNTSVRRIFSKKQSDGRDWYGVLRGCSDNGGCEYMFIIEHCFHTNPKECKFLLEPDAMDILAKAHAEFLCEELLHLSFEEACNQSTSEEVETFVVYTTVGGYSTSKDAMSHVNQKVSIFPGTYFVYKIADNESINLTSNHGSPGAWINPFDNVKPAPDIDLSSLTKISIEYQNLPEISFEQAVQFIRTHNPNYKITVALEELIYFYIVLGYKEDIRWDLAVAQAIKETGYFAYGNQVTWDQNNYAGIGATNNGASGHSFETAWHGVLAHIQHLKAYSNTNSCLLEIEDPRFQYVERGCAPYVEWLGAKNNPSGKGWAVPGDDYGKSILKILDEIKTM